MEQSLAVAIADLASLVRSVAESLADLVDATTDGAAERALEEASATVEEHADVLESTTARLHLPSVPRAWASVLGVRDELDEFESRNSNAGAVQVARLGAASVIVHIALARVRLVATHAKRVGEGDLASELRTGADSLAEARRHLEQAPAS